MQTPTPDTGSGSGADRGQQVPPVQAATPPRPDTVSFFNQLGESHYPHADPDSSSTPFTPQGLAAWQATREWALSNLDQIGPAYTQNPERDWRQLIANQSLPTATPEPAYPPPPAPLTEASPTSGPPQFSLNQFAPDLNHELNSSELEGFRGTRPDRLGNRDFDHWWNAKLDAANDYLAENGSRAGQFRVAAREEVLRRLPINNQFSHRMDHQVVPVVAAALMANTPDGATPDAVSNSVRDLVRDSTKKALGGLGFLNPQVFSGAIPTSCSRTAARRRRRKTPLGSTIPMR